MHCRAFVWRVLEAPLLWCPAAKAALILILTLTGACADETRAADERSPARAPLPAEDVAEPNDSIVEQDIESLEPTPGRWFAAEDQRLQFRPPDGEPLLTVGCESGEIVMTRQFEIEPGQRLRLELHTPVGRTGGYWRGKEEPLPVAEARISASDPIWRRAVEAGRLGIGAKGHVPLVVPVEKMLERLLLQCGSERDRKPEPVFSSAFTQLELDECEVLRLYDESEGRELRCVGYRQIPVFVSIGDMRHDVDVGVRNDRWSSPTHRNKLGSTLEWRLRDGEPLAVIVRYELDGDTGATMERTELAVITIGQEGSPGCLVGWVSAGAQPSQLEAARALADEIVSTEPCAARNSQVR